MKERFATIGNFDGVHAGHRYLLAELKRQARLAGMTPAAFVLTNHPLSLIAPDRMPPRLTTPERRLELVEREGVEAIPLSFDETIRSLTSREFMAKIADEFGIKGLMTGYDHKFGSDRASTFADYVNSGRDLGIIVTAAPELPGLSSSAIRKALLRGDVRTGADMLGYPYRLDGRVIHGMHLGSRIGFPTANLQPASDQLLIPAIGVYATLAVLPGFDRALPAVTNIGVRPTVADANAPVSIETHIPGLAENLYGHPISLDFIDRIRNEKRFPSVDHLKKQLAEDTQRALQIIASRTSET